MRIDFTEATCGRVLYDPAAISGPSGDSAGPRCALFHSAPPLAREIDRRNALPLNTSSEEIALRLFLEEDPPPEWQDVTEEPPALRLPSGRLWVAYGVDSETEEDSPPAREVGKVRSGLYLVRSFRRSRPRNAKEAALRQLSPRDRTTLGQINRWKEGFVLLLGLLGVTAALTLSKTGLATYAVAVALSVFAGVAGWLLYGAWVAYQASYGPAAGAPARYRAARERLAEGSTKVVEIAFALERVGTAAATKRALPTIESLTAGTSPEASEAPSETGG